MAINYPAITFGLRLIVGVLAAVALWSESQFGDFTDLRLPHGVGRTQVRCIFNSEQALCDLIKGLVVAAFLDGVVFGFVDLMLMVGTGTLVKTLWRRKAVVIVDAFISAALALVCLVSVIVLTVAWMDVDDDTLKYMSSENKMAAVVIIVIVGLQCAVWPLVTWILVLRIRTVGELIDAASRRLQVEMSQPRENKTDVLSVENPLIGTAGGDKLTVSKDLVSGASKSLTPPQLESSDV